MTRARTSLVAAGLVDLGAAVWFASSWLDRSDADVTCGSLWRSDLWLHVHGCTGSMTWRLVTALVLALLGCAGILLAIIHPPRRALMISGALTIVAALVLVVNEYVRSGGSLAN